MSWLFFALLAPALSSTVNFLDKYIVKGQEVDYKGMPIFAAIASVSLGFVIWIFDGFALPKNGPEFLLVLAGLITFSGTVIYFKVVHSVAVSKILILFQMTPVFVLILSYLFLEEHLNGLQVMGFFLIILAALGLTWRGDNSDNSAGVNPYYFILIIIVDLFYATANVIVKYATEYAAVSNVYIYQSWGIGMGALILFCLRSSARNSFIKSIRELKKWPLVLVFLNEGIFNVGKLLTVEATSMKSVSLVNVVGSTQVFFGILYGLILNKISPRIFQENSNRKTLIKELSFASIMFAGVFFIY